MHVDLRRHVRVPSHSPFPICHRRSKEVGRRARLPVLHEDGRGDRHHDSAWERVPAATRGVPLPSDQLGVSLF